MSLKRDIPVYGVVISLLVSFMSIMLISLFLHFDLVSNSLGMQILQTNEVSTQSANAVTSVVTYFRGFDTLGEVTILFLSIFGISLGLDGYKDKLNIFAYENNLLKIAVDVLFPLIIIFGFYVIIHGHLSPGGGFQGGVIIASAFLLMFLAKNDDFSLNHKIMGLIESLSGASFILIGILGLLIMNRFFDNFLPLGQVGNLFSGGVIPLIYIFVGIKVSAEITALVEYFIRIKDVK
jgi:multicomponent Na+:H+ antiporter subunit B